MRSLAPKNRAQLAIAESSIRPRRASKASGRSAAIRVRRALTNDLDVLVDHRLRMFEALEDISRVELHRASLAYRRWAETEMNAGRFIGFIATASGGRPIASGGVWLQPTFPRPGRVKRLLSPYLMSMFTEPAYRHVGAGTAIVQSAIDWAVGHRFPRLVLHASRFGRPLYRKLGFVRAWEMRLDFPTSQRFRRSRK